MSRTFTAVGVLTAVRDRKLDLDAAHVALAEKIVDALEASGLVRKAFSLPYLPVCGISLPDVQDGARYFDAHPKKTAWKEEWSKHLGSCRLSTYAELRGDARPGVAAGMHRSMSMKVQRQGRGMALDGIPLLEQEPGLFFSKLGEALDCRSDPPAWRSIRLLTR